MTSRISLGRPQGGVSSGYGQQGGYQDPHGFGNTRPSSGYRAANPDDPLEKIRAFGKTVEDNVEIYSQPLKPHLPAIGRFMIIVTFLEDALRIMTQWGDQLWYLQKHRKFPWGIAHTFLLLNIIVMVTSSGAIVTKRHTEFAVAGLVGVVIAQGFGYGLIFDLNFFLRNLSVVGGLFMVFSESMISRNTRFAGLPTLSENDRRKYFLLTGRILLIFLFLGFIFQGTWSIGRAIMSVFGFGACAMVAVGFKAKWASGALVVILSFFNIIVNNWWSVAHSHPARDFLKYDFFQTLSIVGGLILLVNMGPGGLSVDEKKKNY
ncbi:SURF4-domain-containing protein [Peniophora sp. CONT]|nr:SURF4-domain-containing protein [Peniophora sp. CONT]